MENKLTISNSMFYPKYTVCDSGVGIAIFINEKEAQNYVAWKNQKGIDEDIKESLIIALNLMLRNTLPTNENVNKYNQAIETINSLKEI